MDANATLLAGLLGLIEGLTEFLPVSSTGHLLLAGYFLGFESAGRTFEVVIQLGAVLAIMWVYWTRLWDVAKRAPTDPDARNFVLSVLVGCVPAAILGALLHDFIKEVLFEQQAVIAIVLILGGIVLLFIDKITPETTQDDAFKFPLGMAFKIGVFQCLALIPGTSRSGATIVGALLLGSSKRAAAEFSFFLSIPVMFGATTLDLYKNWDVLDTSAVSDIVVGFLAAFVTALVVVRWLLSYVSQHGYALFGWWRIIVGIGVLIALNA